jgi:oligopeptide transport system ATP-binding protein
MRVGSQVSESLRVHKGLGRRAAFDKAVRLLEIVALPDPERQARAYPHELSGGMMQRVMLAIALSCSPTLLIADEPTTALDVTIQAQIIDLVKRLQEDLGMAVIWITHDLGVVARLTQRVIVMYAGYIIEDAVVKELYGNPRHPYTIGLLGSLPRLDEAPGTKLFSIPGQPPDLVALPEGCPFAPRCNYVVERCKHENPVLERIGPNHMVACWEKDKTEGVWKGVQ